MQVKKLVLGFVIPIVILVLWYTATTFMNVPTTILPKIRNVIVTAVDMSKTGQLPVDLGISIGRVVKGFLVSAIVGVVLGSAMGMSETAKELLLPTITTIRQIPMIAWIPLIILWAGIGEASKVIIIVIAAVFPILVNTMSGITGTPKGYVEVAKLYKLGRWQTFTKVFLPHALPQMLVGLKLGLGGSWMAVVASELIAATSGIGYRMNEARSLMRSDKVIVCMIVIGIVGILMDKVISVIFEKITPWIQINEKKA